MKTRCERCAIEFAQLESERCPICLGNVVDVRSTGDGALTFRVTVATAQFSCDKCGATFVLDASNGCPSCGEPSGVADGIDPRAKRRQERYRARVQNLRKDLTNVEWRRLKFPTSGPRMPPDEYLTWLHELVFGEAVEQFNVCKSLLSATDWDGNGKDQESRAQALSAAIDRLIQIVHEATTTRPPPALIGVHRQSTRAVAGIAASMGYFFEVLVASYLSKMQELQGKGQAAMDQAAALIGSVGPQVARMHRLIEEPGWWQAHGLYDTGRTTWELVDNAPTTVAEAAQFVRKTFADIPQIASLPDAAAFMLGPAALISGFHDPLRLAARIRAVLRTLGDADQSQPTWIADKNAFAQLFDRAHEQLAEQVVIFGYHLRSGAPRTVMIPGAIGVYQKFMEGPLRRFGAILAAALQAKAGVTGPLTVEAMGSALLGPVIGELERGQPILARDVDFLARNADSHYEFQLSNTGIELSEPPRHGKQRTRSLTDDDFLEELLNLNELLVAMEAGLLAYAWNSDDPQLRAELEAVANTPEQVLQVIKALAGLKGWVEILTSREGTTMRLRGRFLRDATEIDPFVELLPSIAAIFGAMPDVDVVIAETEVIGEPRDVRFDRAVVVPDVGSNALSTTHSVGIAMANVLSQSQPDGRALHEARYVLVAAVIFVLEALLEIMQQQHDGQLPRRLGEYLDWVLSWLPQFEFDPSISTDRDQLITPLREIRARLGPLRAAIAKRDDRLLKVVRGEIAQRSETLQKVHAKLREMYP